MFTSHVGAMKTSEHQRVYDAMSCARQVLRCIASDYKVWKQVGILRVELGVFLAVVGRWEDRE